MPAPHPDPLSVIRTLTKPYPGMGESLGRRKWRRVKSLSGRSSTCFHLMSRLCEGVPFFDDTEKEAMVLVLRRLAKFCGLRLLTHCVMGNHFHALVRVPDRATWLLRFEGPQGDARLLEHLRILYSKGFVALLSAQWARWRQDGRLDLLEASRSSFIRRFCDISTFGQEVKSRFARWYNHRHERRGALWMGRFKSVLVEGLQSTPPGVRPDTDALKVMAAYIDLNPVRAGLVDDPGAYRWTGWTAAGAGDKEALEGLCEVLGCSASDWHSHGRRAYRNLLAGLTRPPDDAKEGPGGSLTVRAFTRGVAVGSTAFVEEVFDQWRDQFSARRTRAARPVLTHSPQNPWASRLRALRDVRGHPDRN